MEADYLSAKELTVLKLLGDTLIPSLPLGDDHGFYSRKASDLGVEKLAAALLSEASDPKMKADFKKFLSFIENRFVNLLLIGKAKRFSSLSAAQRESYLLRWGTSSLPLLRRGFQAAKKLICFLYYSTSPDRIRDGSFHNPNWDAFDYSPQERRERIPVERSSAAQIVPFKPRAGEVLSCDVCIVGSGSGGSVIAAELSRAGKSVVLLEAGGYYTERDFDQNELSMTQKLYAGFGLFATADLAYTFWRGGHWEGGRLSIGRPA